MCISSLVYGQDLIVTTDGKEINVHVTEVDGELREVRYRLWDYPAGELHVLSFDRIGLIRYRGGHEEVYQGVRASSVDMIYLANGTSLSGRVEEVGIDSLRYRAGDGEIWVLLSDVERIVFSNGYVQAFKSRSALEDSAKQQVDDPTTLSVLPAEAVDDETDPTPSSDPVRYKILLSVYGGGTAAAGVGTGLSDLLSRRLALAQAAGANTVFRAGVMPQAGYYGSLDLSVRIGGPAYLSLGGHYAREVWYSYLTEHYADPQYQYDAYWDSLGLYDFTWAGAQAGLQLQGRRWSFRMGALGSYRYAVETALVDRYHEQHNGESYPPALRETVSSSDSTTFQDLVPGAYIGWGFGRVNRLQLRLDFAWRYQIATGYHSVSCQLGAGLGLGFGRSGAK